jgi:hypothetical protein
MRLPKAELIERLGQEVSQSSFLEERLVDLELALEDRDWLNIYSGDEEAELSPQGILRVIEMARAAYLSNPIINHAVNVQADYVFAQGVNIRGKGRSINAAVQKIIGLERNKLELFGHQARWEKEVQLRVEANIFFIFFTNEGTGDTKVGTIPATEIINGDIIRNPQDRMEPWYYKRIWETRTLDLDTGSWKHERRTDYYPDFRYQPESRPPTIGGKPVHWDSPVFHVKVGGLPGYKFGVPEVYSALDWAKAVRRDLEDYATLRRALARFAWRIYTKGGKAGVAAAKDKLHSALGSGASNTLADSNPPPAAGSAWLGTEGRTLEPIKTSGATISPEEGRRLWYMIAAGVGIPEPILAGSADSGSWATAKTLDRPTELQMRNRQQFWADVKSTIVKYCLRKRTEANKVTGASVADGMVMVPSNRAGEQDERKREAEVLVTYPSILERDMKPQVDAVVAAATLGGKPQAGIFEIEMLTRMLLEALSIDDIDSAMAELFPEGVDDEGVPAGPEERLARAQQAVQGTQGAPTAGQSVVEARRKLTDRDFIAALNEFTAELRAARNGAKAEPVES